MLNNYLVNYNVNTQINNIEYGNIEYVNSFTQKIKFYNPNVNEPLHKFWYFIPNAKITNKSYNSIIIALCSNDKNLIESIKNLDTKTDDIINKSIKIKNKPKSNIKSSIIISGNYPPLFEIDVDNDCICYNSTGEEIKHTILENGSKLLLYIEFDAIIIKNCTYSRRWKVLQMKENQHFNTKINFFDHTFSNNINNGINQNNEQNINCTNNKHITNHNINHDINHSVNHDINHNINHNIPCPPPLPLFNKNNNSSKIIKPNLASLNEDRKFVAPTKETLLEVIGKLKKPYNDHDNDNNDNSDKNNDNNENNDNNNKKMSELSNDIINMIKEQTLILDNDKNLLKDDIIIAGKIFESINDMICNKIKNNTKSYPLKNIISKSNINHKKNIQLQKMQH